MSNFSQNEMHRGGLRMAGAMPWSALNLILLPTEKCNFRCTYCYEDFAIGRMSIELVNGVKRLLEKQMPKLNSITLSWFGGEPLLAPELVLDISRHVVALCRQYQVKLGECSITTNAYQLDRELAGALHNCGQSHFHITLDGPEASHDRTRIRADGQGSFKRIWENLLALRNSKLDIEVLLRLHLFKNNIDAMKHLMPELTREFGTDPRFSVYLAPIEDYGGEGVKTLGILTGISRQELVRMTEFDSTPWYRDAKSSNGSPPLVCYAAQARSFAIRADGRVVKCTHALNDPRNEIGYLDPDGTLLMDTTKMRPWLRGFVSGDAKELACPLQGMPPQDAVMPLKFHAKPSLGI